MKTILIVDDEFGIVDALRDLLQEEGFRVVIAFDGQQGMQRVLEEAPDLVLLDMMLPLLDGREMLRQMRAHPATGHTPVVMMSAARRSAVFEEPDAHCEFLRKPFDLNQLLSVVTRMIGPGLLEQ